MRPHPVPQRQDRRGHPLGSVLRRPQDATAPVPQSRACHGTFRQGDAPGTARCYNSFVNRAIAAGGQAGGAPGPWWLGHVAWRELHPVTRRLIAARAVRSLGQGALTVDFVLFLGALGWSAGAIGALVGASSLAGAALSLAAGALTDRLGRRPFLLGFQIAIAVLTLGVLVNPAPWLLVVATVLCGYGRGGGGSAGPFAPAERAWLAQNVPAAQRGRTFSLNSAAGFVGMGLGALLGSAVPLLQHWLPGAAAYRALFALVAAAAVVNYGQLVGVREERPAVAPKPAEAERTVRRRENRAVGALMGVSAVSALGRAVYGPLLPYWFAVRFGAGPASIGPIYAAGFLLATLSALGTGELATRLGLVRSIVAVRLISIATLVAMPLMPAFGWAAALYMLRSVLGRGVSGARQAFTVSLVRDRRRGLASGLSTAARRVPASVGPAIGGWLMGLGELDLPFYIGAAIQLIYAGLFATVFRGMEPAEEE